MLPRAIIFSLRLAKYLLIFIIMAYYDHHLAISRKKNIFIKNIFWPWNSMKLYYKKGVYLSFFKFSLNLEGPRRCAQNEKPSKFSQHFGDMVENHVVVRRSSDFYVFRKAW